MLDPELTFIRQREGLCTVDQNGEDARLIKAGNYWHAHGGDTGELIGSDQWQGQVHVLRSASGAFRELAGAWWSKDQFIPQGPLHPHPCLSHGDRFLAHVDGRTGRARIRIYDLSQLEW